MPVGTCLSGIGVAFAVAIDPSMIGAIAAGMNPAPAAQSSAAVTSITTRFTSVKSRHWFQFLLDVRSSRDIFRKIPGYSLPRLRCEVP
jgi:hypothetical protein